MTPSSEQLQDALARLRGGAHDNARGMVRCRRLDLAGETYWIYDFAAPRAYHLKPICAALDIRMLQDRSSGTLATVDVEDLREARDGVFCMAIDPTRPEHGAAWLRWNANPESP